MGKEAVAIIGGADGPTSVFVAGRKKGIPLKHRIKNRIYKWKGKRAAMKITAGERSLSDVVAYAVKKYGAVEADMFQARRERIEAVPDEVVPMDFHIYEISLGDGRLEMEIDYHWNIFGISYSGNKKSMKRMKEIAKDLYLYYGVSEEDIRQKTERYHSLLATLSV